MPKRRAKRLRLSELPKDVATEVRRLVAELGARLRPEDEYAVIMLATAWATWKKAQADVESQGRVVMSGGTAIANPALTVAEKAGREIVTLARELGMTPAARKKLRRTHKRSTTTDWLND
jgi:P27 family predicted phage terminase small subunit